MSGRSGVCPFIMLPVITSGKESCRFSAIIQSANQPVETFTNPIFTIMDPHIVIPHLEKLDVFAEVLWVVYHLDKEVAYKLPLKSRLFKFKATTGMLQQH